MGLKFKTETKTKIKSSIGFFKRFSIKSRKPEPNTSEKPGKKSIWVKLFRW